MNVLSLVTTEDPFYTDQTRILEAKGVTVETITIPGDHPRTLPDYGRFIPTVIGESLTSYDLVHANYGLTAPFALAQPQRPVVLSLWGSDLLGEYGWLSQRCAEYCDEVIVMTDAMNRQLETEAHVVPHGVDLDRFAPMDQRVAQDAVGWAKGATHILFPYSPARAVKNYPRARRVVDSARSLIQRPLELHVVADAPHDMVPTYMNAADALLFTSDREGSPNTVKEALACNLPVVATDVGDVRQRLEGVQPSAVCTSDAELVNALVATLQADETPDGRGAASEVSLDAMGERLLEIYASALDDERLETSTSPHLQR